MCDNNNLTCQNGGTCVDFQRCTCSDSFTGRPASNDVIQVSDVTEQESDDVIFAGTFCEKRVCLKKKGCLEVAGDSAPCPSSHLYLLTVSLLAFILCWPHPLGRDDTQCNSPGWAGDHLAVVCKTDAKLPDVRGRSPKPLQYTSKQRKDAGTTLLV